MAGTAASTSVANIWEKILQHMERRVNPHSFTTWFRPSHLESADNGKLLVRVPNRNFRKKLTETYGSLIEAVLNEVGMSHVRVEFVCTEPDPPTAGCRLTDGAAGAPGL